jgi:serine phosphatase RsbU (regulator of sigma subunit)
MSAIVEWPAASRSAWADVLPFRAGTSVSAANGTHAARVQHALSTTDRLVVGPISAASHVNGLYGAGGDFVDLIEADGRLIAVLGDVSGKGVAASLVAAVLLSSVQHHVAHLGAHPGVLLAAVCSSVCAMLDRTEALVTIAIAVVEPATNTVRVASAGHHPMMLASSAGVRRLGPTCPPLGAAPACSNELAVEFEPGDALILASDGITEQPDAHDREFGLERLALAADEARRRTPVAAIARVLNAVDTHAGDAEPFDDRSIIVIRSGHST